MRRAALPLLMCLLTMMSVFLSIPAAAAGGETPDTSRANAVYLYNLENDCVLVEKNTDHVIFPASTVTVSPYNDPLKFKICVSQLIRSPSLTVGRLPTLVTPM